MPASFLTDYLDPDEAGNLEMVVDLPSQTLEIEIVHWLTHL